MRALVINAISVLPIMFIQALFLSKMLEMRRMKRFVLVSIVLGTAMSLINIGDMSEGLQIIRSIFSLLITPVIPLLFSEQPKKRTIFASYLMSATQVVSEVLTVVVVGLIAPSLTYADAANNIDALVHYRLFAYPCICLVQAVTYLIWNRLVLKHTERSFSAFLIFVISQALMVCLTLELMYAAGVNNYVFSIRLLLQVLVCMIADFFILRAVRNLDKVHILEKNVLMVENQLNVQLNYYQNLMSSIERTNKIRHDVKNQVQTAYELIANGQMMDAISNLEVIEQRLNESCVSYCANPIVEATMTDKARACEEAGIVLKTDLQMGRESAVSGVDLCAIFANLMDNAIAACEKITEGQRRIEINAHQKANWLYISCNNTATEPIKKISKKQVELLPEHGLGLSILNDIASRYDGKVEINHKETQFTVEIWLTQ